MRATLDKRLIGIAWVESLHEYHILKLLDLFPPQGIDCHIVYVVGFGSCA